MMNFAQAILVASDLVSIKASGHFPAMTFAESLSPLKAIAQYDRIQ